MIPDMSSENKERVLSGEERRRIAIEEERQRQILEEFNRVNNRVYTAEETGKLRDLDRRIDVLNEENAKLEAEHREKRAFYQARIKAENVKPVLIPVYFALLFFAIADILCILVFRHICDQTPILQYAWAACFLAIGVIAFFQVRFLRKSRKLREPVQERITELQTRIAENRREIKRLEEERRSV